MEEIQISFSPPLAWITLNRPEKHNALTSDMWHALPGIASQVESRDGIRVVLMRGAGGEAFSAGADIAEMRANLGNGPALAAMQGAVLEAQDAWARLATPTIAVIEGACTGGGCGLALACDLRLATPQSYFAIPPARLGLIYSLADSKRLVDLVGVARAKEMLFTARRIEAAEAAEIGLINRVVTASQIEAAATELAETIAGNALNSVRGAKKIINAIASGSFIETAESLRLYNESFTSPEFADRSAAFLRRRSGQD